MGPTTHPLRELVVSRTGKHVHQGSETELAENLTNFLEDVFVQGVVSCVQFCATQAVCHHFLGPDPVWDHFYGVLVTPLQKRAHDGVEGGESTPLFSQVAVSYLVVDSQKNGFPPLARLWQAAMEALSSFMLMWRPISDLQNSWRFLPLVTSTAPQPWVELSEKIFLTAHFP